jgi:dUTP pyrophosphatase
MAEKLVVNIRRLDPDLPLPAYASGGSVGFDLYCREDTIVEPGQIVLLPTGVAVATPEGYMLLVTLRSSTPRRKGLSAPHGIGVIDQDYRGDGDEILCQVYNFTQQPVQVRRGERVAQGIFVRVDRAEWLEVPAMDAPTRGGFGSSGT